MKIKIGKKYIGNGCPTFIIAEGCDNHMGSLEVAKEMAKQAFIAGCDAIKFQHHLPDEEMLPDVPMSDNFNVPLYDFLVKNALKINQHEELKYYCEQLGIIYLCTPFSWKAAQEINELGVEAFKIGSGEMTDIPTLERIARLEKPMIVSTGMCTFEEIDRTYNALVKINTPLALTNCISEYPPVYEDVNLGVITKMIERYPKAVIGHSDHTPDLYTSFAAVVKGAKIIEKHVIISKQTPGPDQSVSIDFFDLHNLIDGIRKIEKSLGNEKIIHKKEAKIREWAFRSIVSLREIKKGEIIDGDMIWSKRPGTGIPSYRRSEVIGKKVKNNIKSNTLIRWEDLE
jgi:N,N'-diacetyllegionaminate synthase